MVKTGAGKLSLTATWEDPITWEDTNSIDCDVVINAGSLCLATQLYKDKQTKLDRFANNVTVTVNENGALECTAKDAFGNGDNKVTFYLNGGSMLLNVTENQTLMNKDIHFTQGSISSNKSDCKGIEVKTGSHFYVHALENATAQNPTVSTISVPIKVREEHGLIIDTDRNAQLIFTNAVYNENYSVEGIYKKGEGTVTFSYDAAAMSGKRFSEEIYVQNGVLQLMKDAVITKGPIVVEANGTLEIHVAAGEIKKNTIKTRQVTSDDTTYDITNSIFSTGKVIKTGDGTLQILSETQGMVSAESWVISSGRIDAKGYISGKFSVAADAMLSPGNSIGKLWIEDFIIGETTYSGDLILNETGSMLLMEIGGTGINKNDFLVASGDLDFHDGSIVYLALADGYTLKEGDRFTAVLSGNNSADIKDDFISKYVRATHFTDLQYIQLESGDYVGKYAITGRFRYNYNAVPEPSTWALLILGVAGLLCMKKLRKK